MQAVDERQVAAAAVAGDRLPQLPTMAAAAPAAAVAAAVRKRMRLGSLQSWSEERGFSAVVTMMKEGTLTLIAQVPSRSMLHTTRTCAEVGPSPSPCVEAADHANVAQQET